MAMIENKTDSGIILDRRQMILGASAVGPEYFTKRA